MNEYKMDGEEKACWILLILSALGLWKAGELAISAARHAWTMVG